MTETYTYDAFGMLTYIQSLNEDGILAEAEDTLSRFLYAGEQYDAVTELYYLRARWYDTTVGRFTQEDTYLGDGRNLYVYVQSNPLKYVDPSGHGKETSGQGYTTQLEMQNAIFSGTDSFGGMAGQNIGSIIYEKIDAALSQLPPEEEQRIRDGVWNVTKGTGVIVAAVASIYVSPATAPAAIKTAVTIMAGTSTAMGAADITEGAQDIYYGSTGNAGATSINPVRDTVFGGNQQNYDSFELALAGTSLGLGLYSSGSFYMPMLSGNVGKYANVLGGGVELFDSAGDVFDYIGELFEVNNETTTLYRVMSEAEYESLMNNGKFVLYDMAMEEKWFATTQEDAEQWASYFYPDGIYKMVGIEVNTNSLSDMYYNSYLDGIGPAYCAPIDVINNALQFIKELK